MRIKLRTYLLETLEHIIYKSPIKMLRKKHQKPDGKILLDDILSLMANLGIHQQTTLLKPKQKMFDY